VSFHVNYLLRYFSQLFSSKQKKDKTKLTLPNPSKKTKTNKIKKNAAQYHCNVVECGV
jgi:hypothetical protein